jgi:two-component system, chemotaxis family, chemotaxis protein CheY
MRILSVDDSTATRRYIKNAVDVIGFDFLEASDGKNGLDVIAKENGRVDLILLDRHMPIMDGMEMLRILKSNAAYKHIPVTMVTMETEREEIKTALDLGARNYLIKPFSQENLIGKILEVLDVSPQLNQL